MDNKYKWNLSLIRARQKEIEKELKFFNSTEDIEKLNLSYLCYYEMLNSKEKVKYTKISTFINTLFKSNISIKRDKKYISIVNSLMTLRRPYIDKEYLVFLLEILENVASIKTTLPPNFNISKIDMLPSSMVEISKKFYESLGDAEILNSALKTISSNNSMNFSYSNNFDDYRGITLDDFYYYQSYINIILHKNLFDLQTVNHEIMHTIDFYMLPKLASKNYYGFDEVCTYTIDYLFIDYLECLGFLKSDIDVLRYDKKYYLKYLANITLELIRNKLTVFKGVGSSIDFNIDDIYSILNDKIKCMALEVLSGVMAYGFYSDICNDREAGLANLKGLMKTSIPNNKCPDFTDFNMSQDRLINLSKSVSNYCIEKKIKNAQMKN